MTIVTDTAGDRIPFVDLVAQHKEIAEEIVVGFENVLSTAGFIGGPEVAAFESEFAGFVEAAHCVGVANGTDAIELALRAFGIGRGDEVVVPANTFIATAEAVACAGADVVLVDCDARFLLLDPDTVAERVTARTRAVIGVDLYGQIAPFERLAGVVDHDRIVIVEDAAQSQGATRHGRPIGAHAGAAATSFYPGKNLGAYGDAGAVVTDDGRAATRIRQIANHGGVRRYEHELVGCNSRMDALQAVVLRAKLRRLSTWNAARRAVASYYHALLADVPGVVRPSIEAGNEHVWHLYVVRVPRRDEVLDALHAAGIDAGVHYPRPVHLTSAFASLGRAGDFPVAEAAAGSILSLPMSPHITPAQQERVVQTVAGILR